jgi:hypothetical protein
LLPSFPLVCVPLPQLQNSTGLFHALDHGFAPSPM